MSVSFYKRAGFQSALEVHTGIDDQPPPELILQETMRYLEFKDAIHRELRRAPAGLTWLQLQQRLNLPYDRPCPTWTHMLEQEIGLSRKKGTGRAFLWRVPARGR